MDLNADFSLRASAHTPDMPWVPSPMAGVDRRMLDRIGDEVARATSIVRYAPGSRFSPHVHTGVKSFWSLMGSSRMSTGRFRQALTFAIRRNPVIRLDRNPAAPFW